MLTPQMIKYVVVNCNLQKCLDVQYKQPAEIISLLYITARKINRSECPVFSLVHTAHHNILSKTVVKDIYCSLTDIFVHLNIRIEAFHIILYYTNKIA